MREPIAIIGVGCRFPGGASSAAAFWRLLIDGVDAIREVPSDRFDLTRLFDPDPVVPGKIYSRWGGFVDGIDLFDPSFFGFSRREALRIDPQHRMLLETAWEALEDAGLPADRLAGSPTGVFIGISTHDYPDMQTYPSNRALIDAHTNSGGAGSIAANRISYVYDLRGPSFAVDTACSSSLVATHLACQSVWNGECDLALVGGVQALIAPEVTIGFCKASMLSPDGRCKAFAAEANGYVRGEGAGVIVLKPLSRALADGDPIYALVRGSAINEDGRTSGMTMPSLVAQQQVLRDAYRHAGVRPGEVCYVEAHGTGTVVGDPIEAEALATVLACERPPGEVLRIGSVKTNIGHLEAASGIAGLIKAILVLKNRQIPPSLHSRTLNPSIPFDEFRLRVVAAGEAWPDEAPALAGVNSFGFGGANAHVVLEGPPRSETRPSIAVMPSDAPAAAGDRAELLVVSARSPESLHQLARAYRDLVLAADAPRVSDLVAAAALHRFHHEHRLGVVGSDRETLADNLDAFVNGEARADVVTGRAPHGPAPRIVFLFTGMGPVWWGMGRQLLEREPVFRAVIEDCDRLFRRHATWSLLDELNADEAHSRVAGAEFAPAANFALQAALLALWDSWGIRPSVVVGHSAGEIAAAYAAGALDLEEAVRVAFFRGLLQHRASGRGGMLAVGQGLDALQPLLDLYAGRVAVAAVNSPASVTLSGDHEAIAEINGALEKRGTFCRVMSVEVPYHSHHLDSIRADMLAALGGLRTQPPTVRIVSEVTGDWADQEPFDAEYWWRNTREPVRFGDAVLRLVAEGYSTFLEVGPHPVLGASVHECLKHAGASGMCLPSLRRNEDDCRILLRTLAGLYSRGATVKWNAALGRPQTRVTLPLYAWNKERVWLDGAQAEPTYSGSNGNDTRILGSRVRAVQPHWEVNLASPALDYVQDHRIHGAVVFPGAAFVAMALDAAADLGHAQPTLDDIEFKKALFVPDDLGLRIQTVYEAGVRALTIHAQKRDDEVSNGWVAHAACRLSAMPRVLRPDEDELEAIRQRCLRPLAKEEFYGELSQRGFTFGPRFMGLESLQQGDGEALGYVHLPDAHHVEVNGDRVHPALFDAGLQVLIAAVMSQQDPGERSPAFLPTRAAKVTSYQPVGTTFWSHAKVGRATPDGFEGSVSIFDEAGTPLLQVEGLHAKTLEAGRIGLNESAADDLYELRWEERPLAASAAAAAKQSGPWSSPYRIAASAGHDADRLSEALGFADYYRDVEPTLERIARAFFVKALADLGIALRPPSTFRTDVLPGGTPLTGPRHRQFEALVASLADVGVLTTSNGLATVVTSAKPDDPITLIDEFRARCPMYGCVLDLFVRCGLALADVLTGRRNAPDVLFSGDGAALMRAFYSDSPACRLFNVLTAEAIAAAVEMFPAGRELHVLEIGGGTGATTREVLSRLPRTNVQFTFTDVSPHFLNAARTEFGASSSMQYALLDVERDPHGQGFEAGAFDIVFAANVVHATRDVARTLAHVRSLVAPGGLVILQELTRGPKWLDLVFGITDGWWAFDDPALRTARALLDIATWDRTLAAAGFEEPAHVVEHGDPVPGLSVLLARAPAPVDAPTGSRDAWLVLADHGDTGEAIADVLRRRGYPCGVAFAGDTFRVRGANTYEVELAAPGALSKLLAAVERDAGAPAGVIHCWSLDMPACAPDTAAASLIAAQALGYGSMLDLLHTWQAAGRAPARVVLVTAGAQAIDARTEVTAVTQSPIWGFGRVLLLEHHDLNPALIDCSSTPDADEAAGVVLEALSSEGENEVALRGTRRYVRRVTHLDLDVQTPTASAVQPANGRRFRAHVATTGSLDAIALRAVARRPLGVDEIEIEVKAASLNFRDVIFAMGMLPPAAFDSMLSAGALGVDCAGVVSAVGEGVTDVAPGDEVVALSPASLASHAVTKDLVARKPARLSFSEAAALPLAYVTAIYALEHIARLQAGERVLIHTATGGVGLAALAVAERAGAEIFATAGSEAKRDYLRSRGIRHVLDSRTLDFAPRIMDATGGRGVDVVLNSLSGEAMRAGLSVLAPRGRFLEIGKADIYRSGELPLDAFRNNVSFSAIQIDVLSDSNRGLLRDILRATVRGIEDGTLPPLPLQTFPVLSLGEGLRTLAQARHMGKVVIVFDDPAVMIESPADAAPLFRTDATCLITGGCGGVGLALADWAIGRGARRLVLMSRTATAADADGAIVAMRKRGAEIVLIDGDVSQPADVARALAAADQPDAPLKGIFHGAMVMDDGALAELDSARFARVMVPKVAGAWNLHVATRERNLDHFVMFSSITSVYGNSRQGSYAAANAFLDALAGHRRAQGLPGLTVNFGVFADVGYVSARKDLEGFLERQGQHGLSAGRAFEAMASLLAHGTVQAAVSRTDWPAWAEWNPVVGTSPKFSAVLQARATAESERPHDVGGVLDILLKCSEANRRSETILHLRRRVAKILGAAPERVEADVPLTDLGMDSLMAVELATVLRNDLEIEMPVVKLLQGVTLNQLTDTVAARLRTFGDAAVGVGASVPAASNEVTAPAAAATTVSHASVGSRASEQRVPAPIRAAEPSARSAPHKRDQAWSGPDYQRWTPFQRFARAVVTGFTRAVADVRIEGAGNVPGRGPVVLAANHVSMWDAPVLLCAAERPAVMFAAEELRQRFWMHWTLHKIWNAIYLRRGEGDVEALARGVDVLQGGGMLGVAPEGHRGRRGLQPALTGVAYLAHRAGAPTLPIAVYGQEHIVDSCRRLQRARVHVRIGEPIPPPSGEATGEVLREHTDRVMVAIARLLPREYRGYYASAVDAHDTEPRAGSRLTSGDASAPAIT